MYLRPARASDAEAIADVARESWHAAYGDFLSTVTIDETIDAWYAPEEIREQVDEGTFFVAVEGTAAGQRASGSEGNDSETVVAFAHAFIGGDGTRPTLARIYACKSYWGSGLGTRLLNAVVAALDTEETHEYLSVIVFSMNTVGRAFYESHGFEVIGRRTEDFEGNDHEELIMRIPLERFPLA